MSLISNLSRFAGETPRIAADAPPVMKTVGKVRGP